MAAYRLKAVNFRAINKNTLKGAVDIITPGAMRIKGVMWHESHGKEWVQIPSLPWTDDAGAQKWKPLIEFETPEVSEAFKIAALDAIATLLQSLAQNTTKAADGGII